jgi:hypothetical protein
MNLHDSPHRRTWDLIPWLVNDTLEDTLRAEAEAHLRECASCREELAFQRSVHAGIQQDLPANDGAAPGALARLFERIDAEDAAWPGNPGFDPLATDGAAPVSAATRGDQRPRLSQWLAAAVIIEALGLIGLGIQLAGQDAIRDLPAPYATLSQPAPSATSARIRLVPSPNLSVGELQSLLDGAGLQIVGSNAGGRILALGFTASDAPASPGEARDPGHRRVEQTVQHLRANRGVLLAEPILASAPPSR